MKDKHEEIKQHATLACQNLENPQDLMYLMCVLYNEVRLNSTKDVRIVSKVKKALDLAATICENLADPQEPEEIKLSPKLFVLGKQLSQYSEIAKPVITLLATHFRLSPRRVRPDLVMWTIAEPKDGGKAYLFLEPGFKWTIEGGDDCPLPNGLSIDVKQFCKAYGVDLDELYASLDEEQISLNI